MANGDVRTTGQGMLPGTVGNRAMKELLDLRDELLDYDPTRDRSGTQWDGLRVKLDKRVLVLIGAVLMLGRTELLVRAWRLTIARAVEHAHRLSDSDADWSLRIAEAAGDIPRDLVPVEDRDGDFEPTGVVKGAGADDPPKAG